jgi:hypothetical protein
MDTSPKISIRTDALVRASIIAKKATYEFRMEYDYYLPAWLDQNSRPLQTMKAHRFGMAWSQLP